jgi:Kef-type K+ transport system membrane component KefB
MEPTVSGTAMTLAQTVFGVALVLTLGAVFAALLRRLRQPDVVAEIVAGIMLGPSVAPAMVCRISHSASPSRST